MTQSKVKPISRRNVAAVSVLLLAALTACSPSGGEAPMEAEEAEPVVEEPAEPEPAAVWPLTGVEVHEDELPSGGLGDPLAGEFGPALSVKIENSPGSRPQGGLEHADVVWEELVEGGITRFVAMFHSDLPETLGPIRSVRPMDAAIAGPAGGVLAFSGGQREYQVKIEETGISMVSDNGGNPGFYRNPNRSGDHRLFGDSQQLLAQGEGQDGPPELFTFAEGSNDPTAVADGEQVQRVETSFPSSRPSWEWDGEVWQRLESGQPATAESGMRLEAVNVVVARVNVRDTGKKDAAGSMVPETVFTGEGEAVVFTGGQMVDGTWEKGEAADMMTLRDQSGEEITLAPGKTWVELVPTSGGSINVS